jgi:hypothetical protein
MDNLFPLRNHEQRFFPIDVFVEDALPTWLPEKSLRTG